MSKLDELIQELCPDGVKSRTLEDCCIILDSKRKPITKAKRVAGEFPYYGANGVQDYVNDYLFEGKFVLVGEDGSVLTTSGKPVVNWAEGKIWVNNHAHIISEKPGVNLRYLFYYLQTVNIADLVHGNIPKLTGKDFKAIKTPVPPLEVQQEIVRLLDEFTAKTAELQTELNKEYEVRKKQYEYYRDSLFSDKLNDLSLELCPNGVQYCELKEIADISTGSHNTNEGVENGMYPFYVRSQEPLTLNSYDYDETAIITAGDGVGVGKVFHFVNGKYALHQRAYRIHANTTKIEDKFLYYYFCTNFMKYIEKTMFKGSVPSIRRPMLNAFKIPVPPLEVQQEIVRLLDDFTAKTTKLQDSLNEELEACKKQYEFYRDKLLTFKELNESEVN